MAASWNPYRILEGLMPQRHRSIILIFLSLSYFVSKNIKCQPCSACIRPIYMLCLGIRGVAQLGLARLPWEQEVAGSNPVAPTINLLITITGV